MPEIFDSALNTPLKKNMFKVTGKDTIWGKVFKNRPSKICGRQPSKNLK